MKTTFLKYITLITVLLFITGCPDFFEPPMAKYEMGMGGFSLTINEPGRTIMPATVQGDFASYTLEFFPAGTAAEPDVTVNRTNANLSVPVLLNAGIWDLHVTAYLEDENGELIPAAYGILERINIGEGETVDGFVQLKPIIDGGMGTFSWNIDYPPDVTFASMTVIPLNETEDLSEGETYYFIDGEPLLGKEDSLSLNAGYYRVDFELQLNDERRAVRREILHIYQNMESFFSFTFTDRHFPADPLGVILAAWDDDASRWNLSGADITEAYFIIAGVEGVDDGNFEDIIDWFDSAINLPAADVTELKILVDVALVGAAGNNTGFCDAGSYADRDAAEAAVGLLIKNGTPIITGWNGYTAVTVELAGLYQVQITFNGEILPPITGIRVVALPNKTVYQLGETVANLTGLRVNNVYADGLERETTDYTVSADYSVYSLRFNERLWVAGDSYVINDVVIYGGQMFVCILDNSGTTPPWPLTDVVAQRWVLLDEKVPAIGYTFFRTGTPLITVSARGDASKTASFEITVSGTLVDTGLPVIYIETENAQAITSKNDYVTGTIMIRQGGSVLYGEQSMQIRGRGNTTWRQHLKKPYRIKLDSTTDFFGMGSERDWVLLANYCDKTLLRTGIAFQLSKAMNFPWTPDARFVELVLNGEYVGNYQLVEHIEQSNEKVNVSGSTGYIIEYDWFYREEPVWFVTNGGNAYSFKHPDEDMSQAQFEYIENYMNEFESVLASDGFDNAATGYQKYIDIQSFAKWLLFQNIIANIDTNHYITKDDNTTNSKLHMGPVWDFEWSMGIGWYNGPRPQPASYWVHFGPHSLSRRWYYDRLMTDTVFIRELQNLWNANKATLLTEVLTYIYQTRREIYESQKLNFRRWDILNTKIFLGGIPLGSFDAEVDCDVQFFINHYNWLDKAINELYQSGLDPLEGKLLILQAYGSSSDAAGATHSFVELYNTTNSPINLNGISLYYADGTSVASNARPNTNTEDGPWKRIGLTGTIPAKGSYLILGPRQNINTTGNNVARYQIPDNSGDINNPDFTLSNRAFKAVLIRSTGTLTVQNPFDIDGSGTKVTGYIDMVGSANEYSADGSERDRIFGFEMAPAKNSASLTVRRASLSDSNNNNTDFASIDYRVWSASNPDRITNEQLEVFRPKNSVYGPWDPFRAPAPPPSVPPVPTGNTLLIFQIGAATDGNISHSFVELYNNGDTDVNLAGYSLQYAEGTRNTPAATEDGSWQKIDLSGTIPPHHSFLILGDEGIGQTLSTNPALALTAGSGDMNVSFVISNRSFKVALMSNTTLLTVQNPFDTGGGVKATGYVDMVGAMNTVGEDKINGFEYQPVTNLNKQTGQRRTSLIDSDINVNDFARATYLNASTEDKERMRPKNLAHGAWNPITGESQP